jgi:hypothetical protein
MRAFYRAGWLAVVAAVTSVLLVGEAQAQRGRGGFGRQSSLVSLAGNEAVQKDLGVAQADAGKLTSLNEQYRDTIGKEMQAAGVSFQGFQDLSDDERAKATAKMNEVRTKVDKEFEGKLKEALSAEQVERLKQIRLQSQGAEALAEAEVAKALALNDEQTKKIGEIRDEYSTKQRELFRGDGDQQERFAKMRELNTERDSKVNAVLTAEQQEKFKAMKGAEFDVAQLRRGRGNN